MSCKEFVRSVLTSVTARNSLLTKLMSPRIVIFPLSSLCLLEYGPLLTIPPSVACSRGLIGPSGDRKRSRGGLYSWLNRVSRGYP